MLKDMIYEIEDKRAELRKMTQEAVTEAQRQVQAGDDIGETANLLVELCEAIKWAKSDLNTLDKEANPTLVTAMDMMGERKFATACTRLSVVFLTTERTGRMTPCYALLSTLLWMK